MADNVATSSGVDAEIVALLRTRLDQGLPERLEDPAMAERVAALLDRAEP